MQYAEADSLQTLQDGKGGGEGFEVQKYGDGRVALIGAASSPVRVLVCDAWPCARPMEIPGNISLLCLGLQTS